MIAIKKDAMRYRDPETGKFVGVSLIGGDAPSVGTPVEIDDTLTQSGKAADAKAVGDQLSTLNQAIDAKGDPTDEQVSTAVNAYLTENPVAAGWNNTQINLLEQLLDKLAYTDPSVGQMIADALIVSLRNGSSGGESGGGDSGEGGGGSTEVTLNSIQASYSGGDVVVGTPVNSLSAAIVVIANYNDGSTQVVTDYTLSGEIAEGANTVTVTYQGLTATITVNGVAEVVKTYTITNSLTKISTDNANETVEENSTYTATLTPDEGYNIGKVTVTMGGVDITSTAYSGGVISIAKVTGNVVIIAAVVSTLVYSLPEATTFDGTNYVDTGYVLNDVDKDFSILVEFEPAQNSNNMVVFSADKNGNKYGPNMSYATVISAYRLAVGSAFGNGYLLDSTLKSRAVITHKKGSGTFDFYNIDGRLSFGSHAVVTYDQYTTNAHTLGNSLPVRLGARCYSEADFFKGTIHRFEIYEAIVSSEEIDQFIAATWEEPSEPVNLIDKSTLTAGPTSMPDGRAVTADHYLTDFIPIEYGAPYVANITKYINETETVSNQYAYMYDSDKKWVNKYIVLNNSGAMATNWDMTQSVIEKAATRYVRIAFHKNYLDTAFFGEGRV